MSLGRLSRARRFSFRFNYSFTERCTIGGPGVLSSSWGTGVDTRVQPGGLLAAYGRIQSYSRGGRSISAIKGTLSIDDVPAARVNDGIERLKNELRPRRARRRPQDEAKQAAKRKQQRLVKNIGSMGRQGDWQGALRLFDEVRSSGEVPMNVIIYTSLMHALARSGKWRGCFTLLAAMEAEGIQPNAISYLATITACKEDSHWEGALEALEKMKSVLNHNDPRFYFCFSAAIDACSKSGQVDRALEVFDSMEHWGWSPNPVIYAATMDACVRENRWERALALFDSMDSNLEKDEINYGVAMDACARGKLLNRALSLRDEMISGGLRPDVMHYYKLIDICAQCANWEKAVELVDAMRSEGLKATCLVLLRAARACTAAQQYEKVRPFILEMFQLGAPAGFPPESCIFFIREVVRAITSADGQAQIPEDLVRRALQDARASCANDDRRLSELAHFTSTCSHIYGWEEN